MEHDISYHMEIPYSVSPDAHFETDFKLTVKCHRVVR